MVSLFIFRSFLYRSIAWQYFTAIPGDDNAKCNICQKVIKMGASRLNSGLRWSCTQKPTKGALLVYSTTRRGCTQKSGRIDQEVRERPIERWIRGVPPPAAANRLPEVLPGIRSREAKPGGNDQDLRKNELFFTRYSTNHFDGLYQVFHWIWNWRWSHMFALYCWGMAS